MIVDLERPSAFVRAHSSSARINTSRSRRGAKLQAKGCVGRAVSNPPRAPTQPSVFGLHALWDRYVVHRWRTHRPHSQQDEDERVHDNEAGHVGCQHSHVPRFLVVGHHEQKACEEGANRTGGSERASREDGYDGRMGVWKGGHLRVSFCACSPLVRSQSRARAMRPFPPFVFFHSPMQKASARMRAVSDRHDPSSFLNLTL